MKKRILCFGDSNTFGYISGSNHQRYDSNKRWTGILQNKLGNDFLIIEEGLNSRTIISSDPRPGREGRCGYDYLLPCIDSHEPLDLVIVMLGTNEVKVRYDKSAIEIAQDLEKYIINGIKSRPLYNSPDLQILIITPVKVDGKKASTNFESKYDNSSEIKSIELENYFKTVALKTNCHYLSALDLETGVDGVHLTETSHEKLAEMVCSKIKEIYKV